jgi:hypothetical protein
MTAKRELIEPHTGEESDDVGRSLSQDRRRKAKTIAKPGQGDRGDRRVSR